jgi:hypothetical protein
VPGVSSFGKVPAISRLLLIGKLCSPRRTQATPLAKRNHQKEKITMGDPRKEVHFSLTIGQLNSPNSAVLTIDWGPEDYDVPTYCWKPRQGPDAAAIIANQPFDDYFVIASGTHIEGTNDHPRVLKIPNWGSSGQPNIIWSDQDTSRRGEIPFQPGVGLCPTCPPPPPTPDSSST